MPGYSPPINDFRFLLAEIFDFDEQMAALEGFDDASTDLAISVANEFGRFCTEVLVPLNSWGDKEGAVLVDGVVKTPAGFAEAYRLFVAGGWGGLSGSRALGGQGLPRVVQFLLDEMMSSANMSFGMFSGLTRGAIETIDGFAAPALKAAWLPKMVSGEWTGAMALTEASAGTDLGLLSTRAEPDADGSYRIHGTKIFISAGDHDFGGNIVHLVLARLRGAVSGVKGISLFLVPKFLGGSVGGLGVRNAMSVGSLERKMGIHAQPTCVMNYDGATGWLIGEQGEGLNAMFTMMNAERLFVGIQGLGIAEAASQRAVAYARERRQGRSPDGLRSPVPIIEHPDVRKMLLTGRAFVEAARALTVWVALQMDIASRHPDATQRNDANDFVALLTPVVKAAFTDLGFETAVTSQQVFGGHGYIREWGMDQFVRDARITQIYEGTNGVQAMDLIARKLSLRGGSVVQRFFTLMRQELAAAGVPADAMGVVTPVVEAVDRLERSTQLVISRSGASSELGAAATDYLRLFALIALGWQWARIAIRVSRNAPQETATHRHKLAVARFFVARILPQALGLERSIAEGGATLMCPDAMSA